MLVLYVLSPFSFVDICVILFLATYGYELCWPTIYCISIYTESRTKQISSTFSLFVEQCCKENAMDFRKQFFSSYTSTNSFGGMLDDLFVWNGMGRHFDMYYSVHNFDGHKQKRDRSCSFQPEDVVQCCTHVLQKLVAEEKNIFKVVYCHLAL